MNISELQKSIADKLNQVEALVQGGCLAIAENTMDVQTEVSTHLRQACGVAIIVLTPKITRDASGWMADGIPVDVDVQIDCIEIVATNRAQRGNVTSLTAAEIVANALDGEEMEFEAIEQTSDARTGTLTARVSFGLSMTLDKGE